MVKHFLYFFLQKITLTICLKVYQDGQGGALGQAYEGHPGDNGEWGRNRGGGVVGNQDGGHIGKAVDDLSTPRELGW